MQEKTLPGQHSLSKTLRAIHRIFVVVDKKTEKEKKAFLKTFKALATKDFTKAWQYILKQDNAFVDEGLDMASPVVLFQNYALPAYIGKKDHGVMFCKGLVIGLKLVLPGNANMSYRLDFATDEKDPEKDKRLHLNFEIYDGEEKYPICILLRFSTGRYGFSQQDYQKCLLDPAKMLAFLEIIKVKFWLKMTLGKTWVDRAAQAALVPQVNNVELPAQQLMAFVKGDAPYAFDTVKNYICSLLPGDVGKARLNLCRNEQELFRCINERPPIRANMRHDIFVRIAEKDDSGILLSGLHHLKDAVQADSDQRIDSEQPPVQIRPLM